MLNAFKKRILVAEPENFREEIFRWQFAATFIVVALLVQLLSGFWIFEYAGLIAKDQLTELRQAKQPQTTEIVKISDADLQTTFEGHAPLSVEGLSAIVNRILAGGAAVVAVDIDTSARRFQSMPPEQVGSRKVVWARPASVEPAGWWRTEVRALPVLGQQPTEEPRFSGLALFPSDRDWTVRKYVSCIKTVDGAKLPSFIDAILQAKRGQASASCEGGATTLFPMEDRYRFNPISLEELSKEGKGVLAGKIVLLGGSYSYLDKHPTPFGVVDGVDMVATAVEANASRDEGGRISEIGELAEHWGMKLCLTIVLVFIHSRFRPLAALFATMLILTFLIVFGFSIAFLLVGYSPDFVPFLVGIWIEQLYEGASKAEKLE